MPSLAEPQCRTERSTSTWWSTILRSCFSRSNRHSTARAQFYPACASRTTSNATPREPRAVRHDSVRERHQASARPRTRQGKDIRDMQDQKKWESSSTGSVRVGVHMNVGPLQNHSKQEYIERCLHVDALSSGGAFECVKSPTPLKGWHARARHTKQRFRIAHSSTVHAINPRSRDHPPTATPTHTLHAGVTTKFVQLCRHVGLDHTSTTHLFHNKVTLAVGRRAQDLLPCLCQKLCRQSEIGGVRRLPPSCSSRA